MTTETSPRTLQAGLAAGRKARAQAFATAWNRVFHPRAH